MITWLEQWLRTRISPYIANERGQDVVVILLLLFVIWLLVLGKKVVVQ